jgi:hypothetical protein
MFAAAAQRARQFEIVDGDFRKTVDLKRRQEELQMPPDEIFRHIQAPALAIAGGEDLNVPASHAARAVSGGRCEPAWDPRPWPPGMATVR